MNATPQSYNFGRGLIEQHRGVLGILTVLSMYGLFNAILFAADGWQDAPEPLIFAFAGCCAIQPVLLGLWAALGPGAFMLRLPLVVNGLAMVTLATTILPPASRNSPNYDSRFFAWLGPVATIVFCFAMIIGGLARWWTRQSIRAPGSRTGERSPLRF